jgi:hypothetical protein
MATPTVAAMRNPLREPLLSGSSMFDQLREQPRTIATITR